MEYRRLPRSGCDLFLPSGIGTLWQRTDAAQRKRAAIGQLLLPVSSPTIPSFPPLVCILDGVIAHNDSECDKTFRVFHVVETENKGPTGPSRFITKEPAHGTW